MKSKYSAKNTQRAPTSSPSSLLLSAVVPTCLVSLCVMISGRNLLKIHFLKLKSKIAASLFCSLVWSLVWLVVGWLGSVVQMFWGGVILSTCVLAFENRFSLTGTCTKGDTFCLSVGSHHCAWWTVPSVCETEETLKQSAFATVPKNELTFPCECGRVDWQQRGMTFTNGKYCTYACACVCSC